MIYVVVPTIRPTRYTIFTNLFILSNTLHVSDGLSVHHQELKIVHTATRMCQAETATFLLAGTRWFHLVILYMFRTVFQSIIRS